MGRVLVARDFRNKKLLEDVRALIERDKKTTWQETAFLVRGNKGSWKFEVVEGKFDTLSKYLHERADLGVPIDHSLEDLKSEYEKAVDYISCLIEKPYKSEETKLLREKIKTNLSGLESVLERSRTNEFKEKAGEVSEFLSKLTVFDRFTEENKEKANITGHLHRDGSEYSSMDLPIFKDRQTIVISYLPTETKFKIYGLTWDKREVFYEGS
jgi:hypothetical protein